MMVHDYSRRYSSVVGQRQRVADRRVMRDPNATLGSKLVGSAICLLVMAGIGASLWVNDRIESGLVELTTQLDRQQALMEKNRQLDEGHHSLLLAETMEKKAAALGLIQRDQGQIISMR